MSPCHDGIPANTHADFLPKAGASLPTAMVPYSSPQLLPNLLHPISQMEMSLLYISPSISTVPFQQFIWGIDPVTPHML